MHNGVMRFDWLRLTFRFSALEPVLFPPVMAANVLRGALGMLADDSLYARVFKPVSKAKGPSGLADLPRPFVFRARLLDGRVVAAGQEFGFVLHLFMVDLAVVEQLRQAFASLETSGLGPTRGRVRLLSMDSETQSMELDFQREAGQLRVDFLTPTELKINGDIASQPDFPALFNRVRDRVSTLRSLYGSGSIDIDFQAMAARAKDIRMMACDVHQQPASRFSTRTKQTHSLGGFTGTATYEGSLGEFIPWLKAAQATGVGRQCVWGKGEIQVLAI